MEKYDFRNLSVLFLYSKQIFEEMRIDFYTFTSEKFKFIFMVVFF